MNIFTREAVDKIITNTDLTDEQKRESIFGLYGRALDDGYVSKKTAEEQKNQAIETTKAGFKVPEPVDPKTTQEYIALQTERDMLRAIGGEDFQSVKPKFRETVSQALNPKKQKHTKYMPAWMTWVIFPLSTSFPENKRDTAIPIAMRVKKKPVDEVMPICLAYMAT